MPEELNQTDPEHILRRKTKAAYSSFGAIALIYSSELIPQNYHAIEGLGKGLFGGGVYLALRGFAIAVKAGILEENSKPNTDNKKG